MTSAHILRNVFHVIHQSLALTTAATEGRKRNATIRPVRIQNTRAVANTTATTVGIGTYLNRQHNNKKYFSLYALSFIMIILHYHYHALSFMGGLVSVTGSASYLSDMKKSSNSISVSLSYEAITSTESLTSNQIDYPGLCNKVGETNGPTHVISSVTRGFKARYFFRLFWRKSISLLDELYDGTICTFYYETF